MRLHQGAIVLAIVVGLNSTAAAKPATVQVVVDMGTGVIATCAGASAGAESCLVSAPEGAVVSVTLKDALPGLFTYTATPHERPVVPVPVDLAKKLGLAAPEPPAQEPTGLAPLVPARGDTVATTYSAMVRARQEMLATMNGAYTTDSYSKSRNSLISARKSLLEKLDVPDETSAVAAAVAEHNIGKLPTEAEARATAIARRDALITEVTTTWNEVRQLLATAPAAPTSLGPFLLTFREGEMDIVVEIQPTTVNPTGVARQMGIPVRERHGWGWSTTTGFAAAGLTDHNFSVRTVTVTPATDTEEAVTRREMVAEGSDRMRVLPAFFLHLYPFGDRLERLAITTGASLSPNSSAQIYAGASIRLGRIGCLTAGIAAGNVKRQSRNVDAADLRDLDPQQTRRDAFMTRAFVAITARFAGSN